MVIFGQDLKNEYKDAVTIAPQTATSTATGTGVDFNDCGPEVVAQIALGTVASTVSPEASCTVKLQESADNSTFTDISGAAASALDRDDDLSLTKILTAKRSKRYVRAVATIAGASPSFPISVTVGSPKQSY